MRCDEQFAWGPRAHSQEIGGKSLGAVAVALIALVGTLCTPWIAAAVKERVRVRDLRVAINADLSIYSKLPDGEAKSELLKHIETRLDSLREKDEYAGRPAWIGKAAGIASYGIMLTLLIVSTDIRVQRDHQGALRVVSDGGLDVWLPVAVLAVFLGALSTLVWGRITVKVLLLYHYWRARSSQARQVASQREFGSTSQRFEAKAAARKARPRKKSRKRRR